MAKTKKSLSPVEAALGVNPEAAKELVGSLTPREAEVAELISSGEKNRKIAAALGISVKTLDIHRTNIRWKFKARGAVDIARTVYASKLDGAR